MTAATIQNNPIGFSIRVGGLSVLREIRRELPHEDLLYVADSGHAPMATSPITRSRSARLPCRIPVEQNAKAIVVACNTATGGDSDIRGTLLRAYRGDGTRVKPAAAHTKSAWLACWHQPHAGQRQLRQAVCALRCWFEHPGTACPVWLNKWKPVICP